MSVFGYFFQLGAGAMMGIVIIAVPALWLYKKYFGSVRR